MNLKVPEERRRYHREWKRKFREDIQNREKELEQHRVWRHDNIEYVRHRSRNYHRKNREKFNAQARADRRANPGKYREYDRRKYVKLGRDELNRRHKLWRDNLRKEVMSHYGNGKCDCCGESYVEFLTLDHINRDGANHRILLKAGGWKMYVDIRNHGYPPVYRILCMNCNWATRQGKICPHQRINPKS